MKKYVLAIICIALVGSINAQIKKGNDSIPTYNKRDTIRIGGLLIITKKDKNNKPKEVEMKDEDGDNKAITVDGTSIKRFKKKKSNVSTNWITWDFGFNNYKDETVYGSTAVNSMLRSTTSTPAPVKSDFRVNTGKSINVNFWLFMQKMKVIKNYVGLKYGLGLEINNYRYGTKISFKNNSPSYIIKDSINFSKNKLVTKYLTVPLMVTLNPSGSGGFSVSAGISAGYRIGSYNKQKSEERGKQKTRSDFDLNPVKLALVGDIGYKGFRVYGSYSLTPLHEQGLNFTPYSVGIRFNRW